MQVKKNETRVRMLQASYQKAWNDYADSMQPNSKGNWDYVVLTASNEEQAVAYRLAIEEREKVSALPAKTKYVVLADPEGKRVGSGGATLNVLRFIAEDNMGDDPFCQKRILVIHSGGDSKRIPQYSVCGKLFSPVPRMLPDGRPSTLFDEILIGVAALPKHMSEGMLVMSGDVLILFDSNQVKCVTKEAAAISVKASLEIGTEHGVFLGNGDGEVKSFLHKQKAETLIEKGAVDKEQCVDLDTGAVFFGRDILNALFSLISMNNVVSKEKFDEFVNERARVSFYGDFLYPLGEDSALEQYYEEAAEGTLCDELTSCRTKIWDVLHSYSMKLLGQSPAEFIHFGTTAELLDMMTTHMKDYYFLRWNEQVNSICPKALAITTYHSKVSDDLIVGKHCYVENSTVLPEVILGDDCILSNVTIGRCKVNSRTVLSHLTIKGGQHVVRIYGIDDNPKVRYGRKDGFLGTTLKQFVEDAGLDLSQVFDNQEDYLWFANLFPVCNTHQEAVEAALLIQKIIEGSASKEEKKWYQSITKLSLYSSFAMADTYE